MTPLGQGGGAVLLEDVTAVEVAVPVEVVVERGLGGGKLLEGLHVPELRYRPSTGWRTPSSLRASLRATGGLNADLLTTADNNHSAPLARSVPVVGKRGFVGSTAAWQPVGTESFYPATEPARPRSREGTRSARSAPRLSFWEGQAAWLTSALREAFLGRSAGRGEGPCRA